MFEDGPTDVHDEDQKNCERRRFTVSELSREFPQISHTLYKIITVRLGWHKFCTRWVPKILTSAHKMQRFASDLMFYHKDGVEFLNCII
jgi:hypothetical protein